MLLSIIVPCYNEEEALRPYFAETTGVLSDMAIDYEFVFVDDGSRDLTLSVLRALAAENARVRYRSFSRNFGKESAIYAGLQAAKGDVVTIMDADLQDPPALLPKMWNAIQNEGYDSVATRRVSRSGEPPIRSFFARRFYRLINTMSKVEIVDGARDYRMMTRTMVDAILSLHEVHRFSKGIFSWVGFRTKWLEYENVQRVAGETKWSFGKLFLYAIEGIVSFTTVPLRFASLIGVLVSICAFLYLLYILIKTLAFGADVPGYASLLTVILFLGGIQLIAIGILGEYMARTYMESKRRPIYVLKESNDGTDPRP